MVEPTERDVGAEDDFGTLVLEEEEGYVFSLSSPWVGLTGMIGDIV